MTRPALFLDRDGVINIDYGYVHKPEEFEFIEGIFELVALANRLGYFVIIVTNQAGIGRGYYTEEDFHALTDWMKTRFIEHGCLIDAVYFCPFHPEYGIGKYRRKSNFRKPSPGMLLQAKHDMKVDLSRSIVVGDNLSDMAAGEAAGVGTLFHLGGSIVEGSAIPIQQLKDIMLFLLSPNKPLKPA
jgi:D-glycero-D-manno-heptose 1,7-bisphosphate phosphatase